MAAESCRTPSQPYRKRYSENVCSCGWPDKSCAGTQTDCQAIQPRREQPTASPYDLSSNPTKDYPGE